MTVVQFMTKVTRTDAGCWLWHGTTNVQGYGMVYYRQDGKRTGTTAHRWLWQAIHGKLDRQLELDHLCRVRNCVCPDHVEPVTHRQNMERGANATKAFCKHGHSLTDAYTYRQKSGIIRHCRMCSRERYLINKLNRAAA